MPNLSIKDVPEPLAEALRLRAALNHRSLQGELMAIIAQAAGLGVEPVGVPAPAGLRHAAAGGVRLGRKTIEEVVLEMQALGVQPVDGQPLAVDILRADRDAR